MEAYFKLVTRGLKVVLKGDQEFVRETLTHQLLSELLYEFAKERSYFAEREDRAAEVGRVSEEGEGMEKSLEAIPTIAELRSRAQIQNNKELVTLVVYYADYCRKEPPTNEDLRRILKADLREKSTTVNSLTTYLQRAKREGWVTQDGKRWRITATGLQKVQEWLEEYN